MEENNVCLVVSFFMAVILFILSIFSYVNPGFDNVIGELLSLPMLIIVGVGFTTGITAMIFTTIFVFLALWLFSILLYSLFWEIYKILRKFKQP